MMSNSMLGVDSKTNFFNSNLVIFNLFSVLGGLAPTSNKQSVGPHAPEGANKIFLSFTAHGARGVTYLLLVRQALQID